ncbi:MAG: hypothetical protein LUE25_04725, partial [Clostridiales bacterium]|nr:hypothetical protein [Clostridiales bacterium]
KFIGWKVYRSDTDQWRAVDSTGAQSWQSLVNGELPDGYSYYLYADGTSVARTASVGSEVHFYAQWE